MDVKGFICKLGIVVVAALTLAQIGCGPDYPKCETDQDCADSDQGKSDGKLFCVNGLCQQCKTDAHCEGDGMECNAGVCEQIPGYCTATADCPGNQKCRENRCGAECLSNDECEADQICDGGNCVAKPECSADADCAAGQQCQNGSCVEQTTSSASCQLETVYFGYDSSTLSTSARDVLVDAADCIKQQNRSVKLEGYADERGTNEYNIALGERRARSVRNYLKSLGVSASDLRIISYGEERLARQCGEQGPSSCQRANRRVEFGN